MDFLIIDKIGFILGFIAIIFLCVDIFKNIRNKDNEVHLKFFMVGVVLLILMFFSSSFRKYEVKYYVDNGYSLMVSQLSFLEPKYEDVEYNEYAIRMNNYVFRIDQNKEVIYMTKKIK